MLGLHLRRLHLLRLQPQPRPSHHLACYHLLRAPTLIKFSNVRHASLLAVETCFHLFQGIYSRSRKTCRIWILFFDFFDKFCTTFHFLFSRSVQNSSKKSKTKNPTGDTFCGICSTALQGVLSCLSQFLQCDDVTSRTSAMLVTVCMCW